MLFIIWLEPVSGGVLLSGLPHIFAANQIESIKPLFVLYSIIGLGVQPIAPTLPLTDGFQR